MNGLELTEDGIKHMLREIEQDMTVQAINLKKVKTTSRIMCELSDGISKIRGYITDARVTESNPLLTQPITTPSFSSRASASSPQTTPPMTSPSASSSTSAKC